MANPREWTPRKAAESEGKTTFLSGKPCKRGHTSQRRVDTGHCIECLNAKQRWATLALNSHPDARLIAVEKERDQLAKKVEELTKLLLRVSTLALSGTEPRQTQED